MVAMKIVKCCSAFILLFFVGCAGVETFHYYNLSTNGNNWVSKDRNTFEYLSDKNILNVEIKGKWRDKDLIGPFPVPAFSVENESEPIKIHISSKRQLKEAIINDLIIILDEVDIIKPNSINRMNGPEEGFYYFLSFQRPNYLPKSLQIKFGDSDVPDFQQIQPLTISVRKESCYWYGDTTENYVDCKGDKLPWEN